MNSNKDDDIHFMRHALSLARRGVGRTWPNPSVGCVIVKNGLIVGRGRTAESGRPHAEAAALAEAGTNARGATAYVSLEPCAVMGRDAPCAQALITAGIQRAVIACIDTNPVVSGKGIENLKQAGVDVTFGVLEEEAQALNKGFFLRINENRPLVTLKTACSLDGKVALGNGQSQWITGEVARRHVHHLRGWHDAVMVGIGTVKADDPMLNARVDGIVHNTVRIVLDASLETPLESKLVRTAKEFPVWIFYVDNPVDKKGALEQAGVRLFQMQDKSVKPILEALAAQGMTRVLVEGGRSVHSAFLQEGYGDEFYIYRAPSVLGADAFDALLPLGHEDLGSVKSFERREVLHLGKDLLEIYARKG